MAHTTLESKSRGVAPGEHEEGTITKTIEHYTSMVPSGTYLTLAIGSIGLAAAMKIMGRHKDAQFIGHWVPTILILSSKRERMTPWSDPTGNGSRPCSVSTAERSGDGVFRGASDAP